MNLPDITSSFVVVAQAASNPGLWGGFVNFLGSIIEGINTVIGNYGWSIVVFTILIRFVLLPLDLKSRASTRKMNEVQPLIKEINEKYKNDPEKRNKKTMELYQKYGVNPFGGCLPMLLQMPLFFALFAALRAISTQELGNFLMEMLENYDITLVPVLDQITVAVQNSAEINQSMLEIIPQLFAGAPQQLINRLNDAAGAENMAVLMGTIESITNNDVMEFLARPEYRSYRFLWINNIWIADSPMKDVVGRSIGFFQPGFNGIFILSVLAGVTSYYQMRVANPAGEGNQQMKGMATIFPLMSVWFTAMYTAAFGIYWVVGNLFQITQQMIYKKIIAPEKEGEKVENRNNKR